MAQLEVKGITKRFAGLTAVDTVSFHVEKGEIISIIGPNGAGKTTLFNLLTGVNKVDSGEIIFEGKSIQNKIPQEIVEAGLSRTFQNIRLFKKMRVVENVLVGTHIKTNYNFFDGLFRTKKYKEIECEKQQKAIEIIESIGLQDRIHEYAGSLPYGEQRQLEIARAIATDAKVLLLDEPAAGMNPQESDELLKFIRKTRDNGFTIILIEHDMSVVMNISDRIYVLDHGKMIAHGKPEEIEKNEEVITAYLGQREEDEDGVA